MTFAQRLKWRMRALGWRTGRPADWEAYREWHRFDRDPEGRTAYLGGQGAFARSLCALCDGDDPYEHEQYLYRFREPVAVEPLHGFVCHGGEVLTFLHGIHQLVAAAKPLPWRWQLIGPAGRRVRRAVLLRHDYGETNYFHFYNDVLTKLLLLRRFPQYREWPWLVSRRQYEMPFFQGFLRRCADPVPEILVQEEGETLVVGELIGLKGMGLTPSWLEGVCELLRVEPPPTESGEKVFVLRRQSRREVLDNQEEIRQRCKALGLRSVDTGMMSLDEQIDLFRRARLVVAEHGAGLANILFRQRAPLAVLELGAQGAVSSCYYFMCRMLGHRHETLESTPLRPGVFRIDPDALEQRVRGLMEA